MAGANGRTNKVDESVLKMKNSQVNKPVGSSVSKSHHKKAAYRLVAGQRPIDVYPKAIDVSIDQNGIFRPIRPEKKRKAAKGLANAVRKAAEISAKGFPSPEVDITGTSADTPYTVGLVSPKGKKYSDKNSSHSATSEKVVNNDSKLNATHKSSFFDYITTKKTGNPQGTMLDYTIRDKYLNDCQADAGS